MGHIAGAGLAACVAGKDNWYNIECESTEGDDCKEGRGAANGNKTNMGTNDGNET